MESHHRPTAGANTPQRIVPRWWYLARYHRPSQLAMRLVRMAHNRLARRLWHRRVEHGRGEVPSRCVNAGLSALSQRTLAARSVADSAGDSARRVFEGRFCFLQHEIHLPDPIDWRLEHTEAPQLWRFHLHYHDYLLDLAAQGISCGENRWLGKAWALLLDWIDANRLDDARVLGDAWHPYCISRRLPVWVHLWSAATPCQEARERVLGSMLWQARYLEHHLEWDLRGNHLLENLRALALMGTFFDGPDARRWLRKTDALLRRQLAEQILPHGEHFERSPGYHAEMLEALLDVRDAAAGVVPDLARLCGETAAQMAEFLRAILHPDGDIPLLGDSCLNEGEPLPRLLEWARTEDAVTIPPKTGPAGGRTIGNYWLYRHADDFLLFDAGPVGADQLPAHAHADLLTLEASVGGRRMIVDSGVFSYDDEPMRHYCRSTAAHNVLQIDQTDQCDMWSRFRMGYRGRPLGLESGGEQGFAWARASHNAYRRLGVPQVGRWLACRPGGPWLCIDWAHGAGRHQLTSWLHFHPEVIVRPLGAGTLQLEHAGRQLQLAWLTPGKVTVEEGSYCPQLGQTETAAVVRWEAIEALPAVCGWCLTWDGSEGNASLAAASSGAAALRWTEKECSIEFLLPAFTGAPDGSRAALP